MAAGFKMVWEHQEEHWMMPELTALVSVQGLYDILFQYLISEEKERMLTAFLRKVENYLKNRRTGLGNGPFSVPAKELEFLEEGLEELKYLQWFVVPVYSVRLLNSDEGELTQSEFEEIEPILNSIFVYNRASEGDFSRIYVYPSAIV